MITSLRFKVQMSEKWDHKQGNRNFQINIIIISPITRPYRYMCMCRLEGLLPEWCLETIATGLYTEALETKL